MLPLGHDKRFRCARALMAIKARIADGSLRCVWCGRELELRGDGIKPSLIDAATVRRTMVGDSEE